MYKPMRRQCAEDLRRGAARSRCPKRAEYGYYCPDHGAPPNDNQTNSRQENSYRA